MSKADRYTKLGAPSRAIQTVVALSVLLTVGGTHAASLQVAGTTSNAPAKAVAAFDNLFQGPHVGARAVHAKGVLCEGTFTPTSAARSISVAPHFAGSVTPILVRLSNFSGMPNAADNDPLASPRGIAIKFSLPDGGDTDIVAHSYNGFPAATPEEFVAFVTALGSSDSASLEAFAAAHPAALAFVTAPKPPPDSYATESFFGVNAFSFTNAAGVVSQGRYRIVPLAGVAHLSPEQAAGRPVDYLARDMADRLGAGEVRYRLDLQIAEPGDNIKDGSIPWPQSRRIVPLGTLTLNHLASNSEAVQRDILFTPLNLVDGILPSDDPMLEARSRAYRISHLRRSGEASVSAGSSQ